MLDSFITIPKGRRLTGAEGLEQRVDQRKKHRMPFGQV